MDHKTKDSNIENRNSNTTLTTNTPLNAIVEQMVTNVLGQRQVGYTADLEQLYGQHRQTIWRRRQAGEISSPISFGGRKAWTRVSIEADLVQALSNQDAY